MGKGTLLFREGDLNPTLDGHLQRVRSEIQSMLPENFATELDDEAAEELAKRHYISPIELLENEIFVDASETKVDVSRDPMRNMFSDPGPMYIPGQRVRYIVPFRGDSVILKCRPSQFTLNPPRGQIEGSEIVFEYNVPLEDVPRTKTHFEEELKSVRRHVGWANPSVEAHNAQVRSTIIGAWQQRRQQLQASKQHIEGLGYPVRPRQPLPRPAPPKPPEATPSQPRPKAKHKATQMDYDVALSFAGEDRAYVEAVAHILKAKGIKVFYDKFETAALRGRNLADHLGDVYGKQSRFVVMFISKHYPLRAWPKHERQSAQARAITENRIVLLPARFDETEIEGMPSSTAYVNLRETTPKEFADLIAEKLRGS